MLTRVRIVSVHLFTKDDSFYIVCWRVCRGTSSCGCVWQPGYLIASLPYFMRWGLSVNPELTILARLDGQWVSRIQLTVAPNVMSRFYIRNPVLMLSEDVLWPTGTALQPLLLFLLCRTSTNAKLSQFNLEQGWQEFHIWFRHPLKETTTLLFPDFIQPWVPLSF